MSRIARQRRPSTARFAAAWIACTFGAAITPLPAGETNAAPDRIGVYDSRAIAYAYFWSGAHQRHVKEMVRDAKTAQSAGQTNRFAKVSAALKNEQDRFHLQVFSTAPIDDVLAAMRQPIERIQTEAGVSQLVSKWDEETLRQYSRRDQIDLTDRLLREFTLTEKQKKVIADLRDKRPLALDEAQKLLREGKL